jgi:hypothetical protein
LASGFAGMGAGQESVSMKQEARARGGTSTNLIHLNLPGLTMPQLVSESDLIVRGRISHQVPRLSDDESMVFTDYFISPSSPCKSRFSRDRPGDENSDRSMV